MALRDGKRDDKRDGKRAAETGGKQDGQRKAGRFAQMRTTYTMAKRTDPRIGLIVLAVVLGVFLAFVLVGILVDQAIYLGFIGLLFGVLAGLIVFGRRAERSAFRQIEGQPGAAAAVLNALRRGWTVTPAVAVNRSQDLVHRAVGRPGIVLVGEGNPTRVTGVLATERKRTARVVGPDVPIHEVIAGDGEGQVPLRKLQRHVMKLPRAVTPAEVGEINRRLRALGQTNVPLPKGPLPRNVRMPRGPRA